MTERAEESLRDSTWITTADQTPPIGERPAYVFRGILSVSSVIDATLTVTCHGIYEAFINGERVGDQELTPGLTSYRSTLYVQEYDVTEMLRAGRNEVRIVVSDGWFRGRCGARRHGDNFGTQIAVIAALRVQTEVGPVVLTSDDSWEVAESEILVADLMDGQQSDLRRLGRLEFAPCVPSADPLTLDRSRLAFSPAPPVRRLDEFPAVAIWRAPSGRQIVDFGQNLNGWVRLRRLGAEGTRTVITHGEWIDPEGDLSLDNLAYLAMPGEPKLGVGQADAVISRGMDEDVFEPRHTTHGFRYVSVDGLDHDLTAADITAIQVRTDLQHTGSFVSSSQRVNDLHRIVVASWRANTCDVPTDCPQRERWGYTGDFQIFARSASFLDDIRGFAQKWLRSLADDQDPSGRIPSVAPLCGVPVDPRRPISFDGAAGWGDAAAIIPWELYRAYGDSGVLSETLPMMSRWVDFAADLAATGRHPSRAADRPIAADHERWLWDTGWQWGEWLEPGDAFDWAGDKAIVATAYLSRSAGIVADSAEVLGLGDVEERYRRISALAADAWCSEFLRSDGTLIHETQANYVRGLAFDLIPQELRSLAASRLAALIEQNGRRLSTGFLSTGMLLPVLADHGYADVAYDLLFQTDEPSWMNMLERGATTMWESWSGVDAEGNAHDSLNHYSKGAVIAFLHEYVGGLRPLEAGYSRFQVAPVPGAGIDDCRVELHTRYGLISSRWSTSADVLRVDLDVPTGTTAVVRAPDGRSREVGPGRHVIEF